MRDLSSYSTDGYYLTRKVNPFLKRVEKAIPPGRCLDLGAGNGSNAAYLQEQGWKVLCVDLNETSVELCRQLGLDAKLANVAEDNCFIGGPFEMIVCLYVFQHLTIAEQLRVAKACWEQLVIGGLLVWGSFLDERPLIEAKDIFPPDRCSIILSHSWSRDDVQHGPPHRHRGIVIAARRIATQ